MRPSVHRSLATVPAAAVAVAVLAVGTAAAPGRAQRPRLGAPRLVATPARLASALQLAPGDRVERLVELRKRGRGRFAAISFIARGKAGSLLASDQRGLRVELRSCPSPWVRNGATLTCAAKTRVVLAPQPVGRRTRLTRLRLHGNRSAHLKLVLSLSAAAGNALQGQLTSLTYSFVGIATRR